MHCRMRLVCSVRTVLAQVMSPKDVPTGYIGTMQYWEVGTEEAWTKYLST